MTIAARALAAVALILATSVAPAADLAQQEQNKKIAIMADSIAALEKTCVG